MPVPSPRNKILPARGNFADLSTNVASLLDGEICYAIDQDQYYQNEGGTLVSVGATKAQGILADSAVQPGDNVSDLVNDANYITLAEVPGDLVTSVNTQTGDVVLGASDVGLGNVDNTSDADKPVSTAQQTALDAKADLVGGVIPTSQIPAIAITEFLGSVGSETEMLALTGQPGDWCLRTDKAVGYVITGADPSLIANWEAFTVPGSAVTTINTQVGDVVLGAADVGAATAAQGALADSAVQPTDSIDILADVDISTTAPTDGQALIWDNAGSKFIPGEAGLVDSVNTQTGEVVLDADDIDDTFTTHKFATASQLSKADNAASVQGSISQFVDVEIASAPSDGDALVYSGTAFTPTPITSSQWDNVTGGINYAGGSVGIGTSTPDTLLHLASQNNSIIRLENTDTENTANDLIGSIQFEKQDPSGGGAGVVGGMEMRTEGSLGQSTYLNFSTSSSSLNNQERLRITSDGLVGIGTSAPNQILDLQSSTAPFLRFTHSYSGAWTAGDDSSGIEFYSADLNGPGSGVRSKIANTVTDTSGASQALTFSTTGNTGGALLTERMRIDSNGNVGIGATAPAEKLSIEGTTQDVLKIKTSAVNAKLYFEASGTTTDNYIYGTGNELVTVTNGAERMRIDSNGNVGIGTSSPQEMLTVNGNIEFATSYRITSGSSDRGNVQISSPNESTSRSVSFGNNYYINSSGTWVQPATNIGGSALELRANNGDYGQILFRQKQDPDAGGAEQIPFFIQTNGNVGIGTSSPDGRLTVGGTLSSGVPALDLSPYSANITTTSDVVLSANGCISANDSIRNITTGTGFFEWLNGATADNTGTAGAAPLMRLDGQGRLGIGTSNPVSTLHLNASNPTITFEEGAGTATISGDTADLTYTVPSGRTHNLMGGNVGIGTNSPGANLEVSSTTGSASPTPTQLRITTNSNGSDWSTTDPWGKLSFYSADNSGAGPKIHASINTICEIANGGISSLTFNTSNGSNPESEAMRIDSNGKVGIGTSSPAGNLHLSSAETTRLFIEGNNGRNEIRASNGNLSFFANQDANANGANQTIFYRNGANESMRVDSSGNVGIGTSNPGEKLEVNGTIKATDINFTGLSTFANDSDAGTGGLTAGDVYKTSTGELRIKL